MSIKTCFKVFLYVHYLKNAFPILGRQKKFFFIPMERFKFATFAKKVKNLKKFTQSGLRLSV